MFTEPLFTVRGTVKHGEGRGRTLGFPTANFVFSGPFLHKRGVYCSKARLADGSVVCGVTNIGVHPTFDPAGEVQMETFLFFDGDAPPLYEKEIEVSLFAFLREEKRFDSVDALKRQVKKDVEAARRYFGI